MPVRVLHILHSMNRGGAENALMNYYRNIDHDKVQFDFLLTEQNHCLFEDEINQLGGKVYRVPLLSIKQPWKYCNAVKKFFKEHPEYHIVHSHTSSKSAVPLYLAKKAGIPVRIAHSHSTRSEKGLDGAIRDWLKKPLRKVATHLFACGVEAGKWLYGDELVNDGTVQVWPNVIECRNFEFNPEKRKEIREKLGVDDSTTLLAMTARFTVVKNQQFAVRILNEMLAKGVDAKLMLVGDGDERPNVEKLAQDLGIADKVIFVGVVPDVYNYLQGADFFLLTSLFEGVPLSAIEAQISGLRSIASTGCPAETDVTGQCSFLSLDEGPERWCDEIISHIDYPREGKMMKVRQAGYDAEHSAVKLQDFYLAQEAELHK